MCKNMSTSQGHPQIQLKQKSAYGRNQTYRTPNSNMLKPNKFENANESLKEKADV